MKSSEHEEILRLAVPGSGNCPSFCLLLPEEENAVIILTRSKSLPWKLLRLESKRASSQRECSPPSSVAARGPRDPSLRAVRWRCET